MSKKDDRLGEFGVNNDGEEMRIIRYVSRNDIDVQFVKDGTIVEHKQYGHFKAGKIKNPFFPTVYGVGFIGIGKFKSRDENGKPTKCYIVWHDMLKRCYDPKYQEKYPSYKGCTVDEKWHNFQVFAEWYYEHYYEFGNNERMTLDKDILHKGNKVYSADNCVFAPSFINTLFIKCDKSRGECPVGVTKYRNKFKACLRKGDERIYLGVFDTPKQAFETYKKAKESYIKKVAEECKGKIPYELYEILMNYEVEIDD